ncbi:M20/M25/M40 family metallo-hydrolase [Lacrimispora sp. 210928-DFI.3.58]|uniref:M20/M25/M40 family metallo-hydrolase n=1 Tax=Lacrimispora sp. 210928-DFI.3.58 TaxID=2883214 RepID=UPI001D060676|nr:M20/M25/M40 family metallo-hydrolase [Lacrimispora sp. 210928-DFI.3.58]MCB7319689.1 M20/M25/M40 family metallo-hydrolase [Lacrimispora sp. 210928-DFI.3.58]
MEWKEQIYDYLKGLVSIPSVSNTREEGRAAEYIADCLAEQAYFKEHPDQTGNWGTERTEIRGRGVAYGLVKGRGERTLILTGHYDVVDTKEYGRFESWAYDMEAFMQADKGELKEFLSMLPPEAREDFQSGEWIFGRGVNDMKGGLAVGMAVLDWYGKWMLRCPELPGNLLFAAVADEEAYSAGMREGAAFFQELRQRYGLSWECLIDLEPSTRQQGCQPVYIGSVGKLLPTILVQGRKAHVVDCFEGMSAIGVLGEYFRQTELAPEFSESFGEEVCPPPTWLQFRDRKESYDVSVPDRAAGYMSVLGFSKTAQSLMERLKEIGKSSFEQYYARMKMQKREIFPAMGGKPEKTGEYQVFSCEELEAVCRSKSKEAWEAQAESGKQGNVRENFETWYGNLCREAGEKIKEGIWNYPQATIEVMDALLTYSGITSPAVVIAYAPPYYPAYHSDRLKTYGENGSRFYEMLADAAGKAAGLKLEKRNYFCGISDLSYCGGAEKQELSAFAANAPMCRASYHMDENTLNAFQVPSLLFGPYGRDFHQRSERVYAPSLFYEVPETLCKLIEQMFAIQQEL